MYYVLGHPTAKRNLSGKKKCFLHCVLPVSDGTGFYFAEGYMETRIAVIAIIVENSESTAEMNAVLHDFASCIIGRMGIPYREKGISLVSVAVDAPNETISALTGRLGNIKGLTAKAAYSKR